ncbi:type IV pilus modification PilV family protein [Haliangium sp.]|uniref:type IV pilus modification PilV family protein n=1 Tax=Haliangium sp. TaxID=2663208 RepID=UPI003D152FED
MVDPRLPRSSSPTPPRRRHSHQAGFSLIEIIIAMAVSLIGLAGLMSLYTTNSKANQRVTRTVEATALAQRSLEELRSIPVAPPSPSYDGPTLETNFGIPVVDAPLPDVVGHANTTFQRRVTIQPLAPTSAPTPTLFRIRMVVRWSDDGAAIGTDPLRDHTVALETIRTRQDKL